NISLVTTAPMYKGQRNVEIKAVIDGKTYNRYVSINVSDKSSGGNTSASDSESEDDSTSTGTSVKPDKGSPVVLIIAIVAGVGAVAAGVVSVLLLKKGKKQE
ncbi:MAG: hypothetical protein IKZ38_04905, partial [Clostridia bacterium]|nr:hypothetical protein [Clostridia bacterium]